MNPSVAPLQGAFQAVDPKPSLEINRPNGPYRSLPIMVGARPVDGGREREVVGRRDHFAASRDLKLPCVLALCLGCHRWSYLSQSRAGGWRRSNHLMVLRLNFDPHLGASRQTAGGVAESQCTRADGRSRQQTDA